MSLFSLLMVHNKHILILGLDNAGKTTLLYQMTHNKTFLTLPTINPNIIKMNYKSKNFVFYDVGGNAILRHLWSNYYNGKNIIIFVIDASDHNRLLEAKLLFQSILLDDKLKEIPILIYSNKHDLPESIDKDDLVFMFDLDKIKTRDWYIQNVSALTGHGMYGGLDWIVGVL